uniref:3'-5' exonuclease domain-containing protein n=1 Tax=Toxocara canis TaxID=6265 RepID=A0A183U0U1_TOXCA
LRWEDRIKILKAVIPLEFPTTTKFWKTANYALSLSKYPTLLVANVLQAVSEGWASFASVNFVMHEPVFSTLIADPTLIRFAALFGEMQPVTVERFASKRKSDFRAKCKEVIYELDGMARDVRRWEVAVAVCALRSYNCKGFGYPLEYEVFCRNVRTLIKSLKGENQPGDMRINLGWARAAVKKSAARYYSDGSWKAENMHEVLWTVCAQRPSMRDFVAKMLESKYNDPSEAYKWRTFNIPYYSRTKIKSPFETRMDPLSPNPPYLSFPECVKSISVVENEKQLKALEGLLYDCVVGDYPIVGLDAEWSSYASYSKATIFQIALRTQVFIIDLDAFALNITVLSKFLDKLFLNEEIVKIGMFFKVDFSSFQSNSAVEYSWSEVCSVIQRT